MIPIEVPFRLCLSSHQADPNFSGEIFSLLNETKLLPEHPCSVVDHIFSAHRFSTLPRWLMQIWLNATIAHTVAGPDEDAEHDIPAIKENEKRIVSDRTRECKCGPKFVLHIILFWLFALDFRIVLLYSVVFFVPATTQNHNFMDISRSCPDILPPSGITTWHNCASPFWFRSFLPFLAD